MIGLGDFAGAAAPAEHSPAGRGPGRAGATRSLPARAARPVNCAGDVVSEPGTVEFELVPIRGRPGCFAAVLPDGRVLIRASRQPLLDGARALAAEGGSREAVITARHRGSTIVAMHSTVGEAGKWRIEESDRGGLKKRRWSPFESARISAHGVPENALEPVGVEDRLPDPRYAGSPAHATPAAWSP
jgi:hypothetical protein